MSRNASDRPLDVLVTGAGTGFGRGVSIRLAERGHHVIAGTLTEGQAADLATTHPELETLKLDITLDEDRLAVAALPLDVLVNNAGLPQAGPLRSIPLDLVRRVFEVNVFGSLAMTQTVVPGMLERGGGRILIMSSVAGVLAGPMTGPYSMTKHALQAMGSALRHELAPLGIDVALINPGPFSTGFNNRMIDDTVTWLRPENTTEEEAALLELTRNRITGAQSDPDVAIEVIASLIEAETTELVNFIPPDIVERIRGS